MVRVCGLVYTVMDGAKKEITLVLVHCPPFSDAFKEVVGRVKACWLCMCANYRTVNAQQGELCMQFFPTVWTPTPIFSGGIKARSGERNWSDERSSMKEDYGSGDNYCLEAKDDQCQEIFLYMPFPHDFPLYSFTQK